MRVTFLTSLIAFIFCASKALTQTPVPGDPLKGSGNVSRVLLLAKDLQGGISNSPIDESGFATPAEAMKPAYQFEGRLELLEEAQQGGFLALRDLYGYAKDTTWGHLPKFSFSFVQNGSHLIPSQQGLIYTGHPHWNYWLGVGRVWRERGDGSWARAALPFALVERNQNAVHNGVMMFLFNKTKVSQVRYQVTQETCTWFQCNLWGQLKAKYTPAKLERALELQNAYAEEVKSRFPTRPLSALTNDFPSSKVDPAVFGAGLTPLHRTAYGLFVQGIHYVGEYRTRFGQYPYPEALCMPSYSLAKSVFASLALMRLAQVYGEGIADLKIGDYLPETKKSVGSWDKVTFRHALNMTTGHYASSGYLADEGSASMAINFFAPESYALKLQGALKDSSKIAPGTLWVYRTSDTFLLIQALQNLLRSRVGASADLFQMLVKEVYAPLGMSQSALSCLRTDNAPEGKPLGGYGLFLNRDDLLKLASLLNNSQGKIGDKQILSPALLASSLQQDPLNRGVKTTGAYAFQYSLGFWALQMTKTLYPALSKSIWITWMSGFGGLVNLMLPNGINYYHVSDNDEWPSLAPLVLECNKLIRF